MSFGATSGGNPATVHVKPAGMKSLGRRHPWIFSGAIQRVEGHPGPGQTVRILGPNGKAVAVGAFTPGSQIAVRVWSFDPSADIGPAFFRERMADALRFRERLPGPGDTDAWRLINSEGDGLPGVVVDRYADTLVCQFLTTGADAWKETVVDALLDLTGAARAYERSDVGIRAKEGLAQISGPLRGPGPDGPVAIRENGRRYLVDIVTGHKTGFYLDQRDNRALVTDFSTGAEVLNCFAYTGGFSVSALAAGAARVTSVEASAPALATISRHLDLNGLPADRHESVEGDVFSVLRQYRDMGRRFDLIVLDPPKFVETRPQLTRACRGYKDINLLAFKLLRPGGVLFTFSCSGLVAPDLFQKIVADAAVDAGRDVRIIRRLAQAPDHPSALHFPEGHYLKGLICGS